MLGKVFAESKCKCKCKCNNLSFQVFPKKFRKFTENFSNVTNFSRVMLIVSLSSSQKSCVLTLIENRINGPDRLYGNVSMAHVPESSQSDHSILRINMQSGIKEEYYISDSPTDSLN